MDDLTARAMRAYFVAMKRNNPFSAPAQPASASGLRTHEGKQYVVLTSVRGVLAVYRVRNDGMLKGLKRWPPAING